MLEIHGLSAGYPGRPVLSELDLCFAPGRLSILVGPNGSGKSTLLKALVGVLPRSGALSLAGASLDSLPPKALAQKIAYLPQSRNIPELTSLQLVLHGRFPYLSFPRRYRSEDLRIARAALERLGIGDLADRPLASLSGGQRQKVYIAMTLAQDTPVILLDEPTASLDIGQQLQLMELLRQLAAEGKTVVAVLHELALALEYGDDVTVLCNGAVLAGGRPEEICRCGALERAFAVRPQTVSTGAGRKYCFHQI